MTSAAAREPAIVATHTAQTYFLAIDDVYELKIAQAWLAASYPHSAGKVVSALPMHRLPPAAVVIAVTRGEDRTAAYGQEFAGNSVRAVHVNPKDLVHEIREATPLLIKDFWREVRDEFDALGGELNKDAFHAALSTLCSPAVAKVHIGSPNVVRLKFG